MLQKELLTYLKFKEAIAALLNQSLSNYLKGAELQLDTIWIRGKKRECLLPNFDEKGAPTTAFPILYVEDLYMLYLETGSEESVLKKVKNDIAYCNSIEKVTDMNVRACTESKDNIFMRLINYEQNKQFLKEIPHRKFLDLAISYRLAFPEIDAHGCSCLINFNITDYAENELYQLAQNNTARLFPPTVMDYGHELILTSAERSNGSIYISFYPLLDLIINKKSWKGIYIIPISVDDVVIVSDTTSEEQIRSIQETIKDEMRKGFKKEFLSGSTYHYTAQKLTIR